MAIFSSEKSYLGIDLGGSSIKLVEFKDVGRRAQLVTYGYSEEAPNITRGDFVENPAEAAATLRELCKKAKTTSTRVIAALPISSVFNSIISLSNVDKKDLASPKKLAPAIQWEARKVLPLPIEEMVLDWKLIPPSETEKKKEPEIEEDKTKKRGVKKEEGDKIKNLPVLITAAAKTLVQKYIEIFKRSNLNLISLETEAFALIRSLVGDDKSTMLVVDVGASNTDISLIDKGIPYLNRSIDVAGNLFTKSISQSLGVSWHEAEQIKYDVGALGVREHRELPKILEEHLSSLFNEINYCLNLFKEQNQNFHRGVEKLILTGGSALLPGLPQYLSKNLNLKVYIGDPWARIIYPEDLKPVLDEIGPKFSVTIGLAMRDIVE